MKKQFLTLVITLLFHTINAQNFDWGFTLGTSQSEEGSNVTRDVNGNVFITGPLLGTLDFNPGPGVNNLSLSGPASIFIAKYNSKGTYQWAKTLPTNNYVMAKDIVTDKYGNVYVLGQSTGVIDLDPGSGTVLDSGFLFFILKLNSSGQYVSSHVFKTQLREFNVDQLCMIQLGKNDNIYCVMNYYQKIDLDPGPDSLILDSKALSTYVVKLDSSGSLLWGGKITGTSGINYINGIDLDDEENLYLTGAFQTTKDFDLFGGNLTMTSNGQLDAFVVKYNKDGNLIHRYSMGTGLGDRGQAIKVSGADLYISGNYTGGGIDFDPSSSSKSPGASGTINMFLLKWDTAFNYKWVKKNEGDAQNFLIRYLDVNSWGNITLIGTTGGISVDMDFDSTKFAYISTFKNSAFACKYDSKGALIWMSSFTGGTSNSDINVRDAFEDNWNRLSICGNFPSMININPSGSTFINTNGFKDIFFTNLQSNTTYDTAISFCDSVISPSGKYVWLSSGKYSDTIQNVNGGDSIFRPNLTNRTQYMSSTISVCGQYKSPSGKLFKQSGTYFDTIPNIYGCFNFQTINLTVLPISYSSLKASACELYISPSGRYKWYSGGIYTDTLKNYFGCDSVILIDLSINNPQYASIKQTACGTYTSPSGKYTYTYSLVFKDTISTIAGCDSILTVNLTILPTDKAVVPVKACGTYVSPSGKYMWNNSGTYFDTLNNSFGCDSILEIRLEINNSVSSVLNFS